MPVFVIEKLDYSGDGKYIFVVIANSRKEALDIIETIDPETFVEHWEKLNETTWVTEGESGLIYVEYCLTSCDAIS